MDFKEDFNYHDEYRNTHSARCVLNCNFYIKSSLVPNTININPLISPPGYTPSSPTLTYQTQYTYN